MSGPVLMHATTVSLQGRGLIILGRSGAGKSGLALQLLALGAGLVADDQTLLNNDGKALIASCPPQLSGLIEARGIGILKRPASGPVSLCLAVDLDHDEQERLPPLRQITLLERDLPLVHRVKETHFASALLQLLLYDRHE